MESNNTQQMKPLHRTWLYTLIVWVLYVVVSKLLFFVKIEGRENIPKGRNCVLMGNHQ